MNSTATLEQIAASIALAAPILFPTALHRHNDTVTVAGVRCTSRDPITGAAIAIEEADFSYTGSAAAGNALPSECSIVLTQRTASPSLHGRMYLPPTVIGVLTSQGRLATAQRDILADAFEAYMGFLLVEATPVQPVVWHRPVAGAGGDFQNVTRIDVGDVVDAQRRRRNKLTESRATRTL